METKYYRPDGGFNNNTDYLVVEEGGLMYGIDLKGNKLPISDTDRNLCVTIKDRIQSGFYAEISDPTKLTIICPSCLGTGCHGHISISVHECFHCKGVGIIELNKKDLPRQFIAVHNAYQAWRKEGEAFSANDLTDAQADIAEKIGDNFNELLLLMLLAAGSQ